MIRKILNSLPEWEGREGGLPLRQHKQSKDEAILLVPVSLLKRSNHLSPAGNLIRLPEQWSTCESRKGYF